MLLFDSELERACERGSVRDRGVDVGSIDSRVNLRGKAAPSESPRFLVPPFVHT